MLAVHIPQKSTQKVSASDRLIHQGCNIQLLWLTASVTADIHIDNSMSNVGDSKLVYDYLCIH